LLPELTAESKSGGQGLAARVLATPASNQQSRHRTGRNEGKVSRAGFRSGRRSAAVGIPTVGAAPIGVATVAARASVAVVIPVPAGMIRGRAIAEAPAGVLLSVVMFPVMVLVGETEGLILVRALVPASVAETVAVPAERIAAIVEREVDRVVVRLAPVTVIVRIGRMVFISEIEGEGDVAAKVIGLGLRHRGGGEKKQRRCATDTNTDFMERTVQR
jgi:hypothetical protein